MMVKLNPRKITAIILLAPLFIVVLLSPAFADELKPIGKTPVTPPPVYSAEKNDECSINKNFEFGLALMGGTGTHDVKHGLGGRVLSNYIHFSPLIINGELQLFWSKLHTTYLEPVNFTSLRLDFSLLLRPQIWIVKPYFGGGAGFFYNFHVTDETPWPPVMGPYDETTVGSKVHSYGNGLAAVARAGMQIVINQKVSLFIDTKYLDARPSMEVNVYDFSSMTEYTETRDYDMKTVVFSFGVVFSGSK